MSDAKSDWWKSTFGDTLGGTMEKGVDWVENKADAIKQDVATVVDKGEDLAKQAIADVKGEVNKAEDWAKGKVAGVTAAVKKEVGDLKLKAVGDQSGGAVPRPMEGDCNPVHGQVPGPKNHLFCSTHGHVVDTDQKMIIANSIASYVKDGVAKAVQSANVTANAADAMPGAGAGAKFGGAFALTIKIPVANDVPLGKYAKAKGSLGYTLKAEPEETAEAAMKIINENGEVKYKAALEKHLKENVKVVGEGEISGKKGELGIWAEIQGTKYSKTSIGFEIMEVDAEKGDVTFAALDWKSDFTIPGAEATLLDTKFKYSGTVTPDIKIEPDYVQIGEEVGKKIITRTGGIVTASIVLGVALCAATMAAIDALAKSGASETDAATKGRQMLRDYADSYAATVLGKSGGNSKEGNADGEAYLQKIMSMSQISRDEAVQDCQQNLESQSNKLYYEYQAWSEVVSRQRQSVIDGWKKEHYIAAALGSQIETVVNVVIEDRYS